VRRLDFAKRPFVEVIVIVDIIELLNRVSKLNALRSQKGFSALRISSTSLAIRGESSVGFVVRGCLKFHLWIAFAAMSDVKGGTNDSHPPKVLTVDKPEQPISRTRSDRIREIFRFIPKL
jgi:hypothetical protein